MKVSYRRVSLRPYPGEIYLFCSLPEMQAKYYGMTKTPYPYEDEPTGGRYVKVDRKRACDTVWLVYGRKPHVLAHEFAHILLQVFQIVGCKPSAGNGEPFCYMLSQLMLESK